MSTSPLISLATVCALWRVPESTVRRMVAKGFLEEVFEPGPMRAPKYRQADVMASPLALREQLSLALPGPVKS
jgi:hypothetical protein